MSYRVLPVEVPAWFDGTARVAAHCPVAPGVYWMGLSAPGVAALAQPGQFVMQGVHPLPETDNAFSHIAPRDPMLRRALSLYRIDRAAGRIELLYRVVGRGTELLSRAQVGDLLPLHGPLGRGFPLLEGDAHAILVGGGIGTAPLPALAEALRDKGVKTTALIGGRTATDVLAVEDMEDAGATVEVATDDGSQGHHGRVTELLERHLSGPAGPSALAPVVYACGPEPMLKAVQALCRRYGAPGYLSLEERMACGIGVCIGCVCRSPVQPGSDRITFRKICTEGPVLGAEEVVFP